MRCRKCGSSNVTVQAVNQVKDAHHGVIWWVLLGWWWVPIKWIFFTFWAFLFKLFGRRRQKNIVKSFYVCQRCGYHWEA